MMMPHGSIMCYNIALLITYCNHPGTLVWEGSLEVAIGYCCLLIMVGQESAPSPISL